MAKIKWKGGALIAPLPPVMVSCGDMESSNILTVAWTGITNTIPPKTYISVRPKRHSYNLIKESGEFVINLTTAKMLKAVDKCGVFSGKNKDKFAMCGLTAESSATVSAPSVAESPISLECKVFEVKELGSHDMFLADITAVRVDEELLDENGALSLETSRLLAYSHGKYYELVRPLAALGFAVKKKPHKKK